MAEMITQRQLDSATNEYQRMLGEEEERRGRTDMFLHPRNVAAARLGMASLQAFRQVISTPEQIDLSPAHRARLAVTIRESKGFRDALLTDAITPGGFDDDTLFAAIVDPHEPHAAQAVEQAVQHGIEDPSFQPDLQRINHAADMLTDIAEHMLPGYRSDLHATAAYVMIVGNRREEASQQIEKAFIDNPSNDLACLEQRMFDFDVTAAWARSGNMADGLDQAPTINDDDQHSRGR